MPAPRATGLGGGARQTAEGSPARWLASLGPSEPGFPGLRAGAAAGSPVAPAESWLARWLCSPAAPRGPSEHLGKHAQPRPAGLRRPRAAAATSKRRAAAGGARAAGHLLRVSAPAAGGDRGALATPLADFALTAAPRRPELRRRVLVRAERPAKLQKSGALGSQAFACCVPTPPEAPPP